MPNERDFRKGEKIDLGSWCGTCGQKLEMKIIHNRRVNKEARSALLEAVCCGKRELAEIFYPKDYKFLEKIYA